MRASISETLPCSREVKAFLSLKNKRNIEQNAPADAQKPRATKLNRSVRKVKKDSGIISRGPFKGKRIEFAPITGINRFREISEDFMNKIFGLKPGEYLISDESSLYDFTGLDEMELPDIHKKIQEMYNIDVSNIMSRNLLEIFRRISENKNGAPC